MSIGYTGCIGLEWNWRPKGMKQIEYDEAISLLVNATYSREWQGNERLESARQMSIDALEKQMPMETGPDELGISARNPVITPCGNCGTELTDRMWDFCPWCGQKIKWRKK